MAAYEIDSTGALAQGKLGVQLAGNAPSWRSDMNRRLLAITLAATIVRTFPALAGPEEELTTLYERFLTAQNARDLTAVRATLWDSPQFLWVSDGMSVWGRDALVERMSHSRKQTCGVSTRTWPGRCPWY